jgi:hypothetical protein
VRQNRSDCAKAGPDVECELQAVTLRVIVRLFRALTKDQAMKMYGEVEIVYNSPLT